MNPNPEKNQPIMKARVGHFQISLWKTQQLIRARHDYEAERETTVYRACIQHSRYHQKDQSWNNQTIWVNAEEIRDLRQLLDQLNNNPEITGEEIREIPLEPETPKPVMTYREKNQTNTIRERR